MKKIISYIVLSLVSIFLFAIDVPPLTRAVNDNANILSQEEQEQLEQYLKETEKTYEFQIALLTIPSLEGEAIEEYSMRVVKEWKLGDEGSDNGVLLLIAKEERKVRIEVGYGLKKYLTDATSFKIISEVITPYFKENNYYDGIKKGLEAIVEYALEDDDDELIEESKIDVKEDKDSKKEVKNKGGGRKTLRFILIGLGAFLAAGALGLFRGKKGKQSNVASSVESSNDKPSDDNFSGKGGSFGGDGATGGW